MKACFGRRISPLCLRTGSAAQNAQRAAGIEAVLHESETTKKLQEEAQALEEQRPEEHHARIWGVKPSKEWYEQNATTLAAGVSAASEGAGFVATAVSAGAAMLSGVGVAADVGIALAHYSLLRSELSRLEDQCAERAMNTSRITAEATRLQATLLRLSSEKSNLAQVVKIVQDSLYHVSQLQIQILNFIDFIDQMKDIMESIAQDGTAVHGIADRHEDTVDPEIEKLLRDRAFEMMAKLVFATRASQIYKEVSIRYIMPELDILPTMRFFMSGTDDEIDDQFKRLNERREEIFRGTLALVLTMHRSLKDDLKLIAETCASSVELIEDAASEQMG
ncbi:hypothetical protein JDV02_004311 [Purpureocillium takamizusanense]|uniref:Uncharacterized protein n=1 Tax=Purpureocillium takamizusanense TaxID=2060973 RepID=A0A9Q8QE62_9HYPO|nr:uncharacterized protein JDV02_004311 [Purpureocillium takamizusanense]UNI18010.1 hypothetical protein JDV02_004311 [Purpureocillium takamizusanense]